jgi:ubiquinol-cytochrome c reductase cytochrome c subunit
MLLAAILAVFCFVRPDLRAQSSAPVKKTDASASAPGNAQNGKKIFVSYGCYECHGYVGQATLISGAIGPLSISVEALIRYLRQPTGEMPPYTAKVVSDEELADIAAYLQSLPKPPPVKSTPLLNQ